MDLITSEDDRHWPAYNAVFSAYAAVDALVQETAIQTYRDLYNGQRFRKQGVVKKFETLLEALGRKGETVHSAVGQIAKYHAAFAHSEPDNRGIVEKPSVARHCIAGTAGVQ